MTLTCKNIDTPLGPMLLAATSDGLCGLWFHQQRHMPEHLHWLRVNHQRWLDQAAVEVEAYFNGQLRTFETPRHAPWGTPFQLRVWDALTTIAWGATTSYGALALQLNQPKAVRAVGSAVGRNPWSIMVPCHRVLGANGSLTGYAGGLDRKRDLLLREGVFNDGCKAG